MRKKRLNKNDHLDIAEELNNETTGNPFGVDDKGYLTWRQDEFGGTDIISSYICCELYNKGLMFDEIIKKPQLEQYKAKFVKKQ